MDDRTLLAQPHLSVVSAEPDFDLRHIAQTIGRGVMVDGGAELEVALGRLVEEADRSGAAARTLDLIGHTRTAASLLSLGDWLIDGADPATLAVFRRLADREVLARLGVRALRLLGCHSATTAEGQATICRLAELLDLEVLGSSQLLHAGHYGAGGFRDCWSFLLVAASELRERSDREPGAAAAGDPHPRVLDLDALPAIALDVHAALYPRTIVTEHAARQILELVRRRDGAPMPGLAAAPSVELAMPSRCPGAYHIAHVLLGGSFLRFFPDGMTRAGILFPVTDADALHRVVAAHGRAG